ncbi:MAG: hypothetical protein JWR69_3049 [Pedosphaera sp.]|nr:hypothetical protein [Pedosphaera sp.]
MNEAEELFLKESLGHARTMPIPRAIIFLRGLLLLCPENPAVDQIRAIYSAMMESDHQLELIHSGQLKLNFPRKEA